MAVITHEPAPTLDEPAPPQRPAAKKRTFKMPGLGLLFGATWLIVLSFLAFFDSWLSFIRLPTTKVSVCNTVKKKVVCGIKQFGIGPSWRAWMGLDKSANDVFAKCIAGARVTLEIGISATILGLFLGGMLGMLAGYYRGWIDRVISIFTDSLLSLPALLLAILLVFRMGQLRDAYHWLSFFTKQWQITTTLAILAIAPLARIVRAQTLAFREREFVLAARSLGAKNGRVILREILPNLVPAMLTVAFTSLGLLIAAEGALAFLGLSVVSTPTWGKMIAAGQPDLSRAWWPTIFPCIFLFLTVVSFNLIGDRMARHFDIREAAI